MDPRPRIIHTAIAIRLAALLLALAGSSAQGRIFESLGRSGRGSYDTLPGWSRAYAAPWVINGGRTEVEVWSASETLGATLDRLREDAHRQGDVAAFFPGVTMAWGVSSGHGRVTRFWCNAMDGDRHTMVFRFSQTESDFRNASGDRQAASLPGDIPRLPGSRTEFLATGGEAGSTLAVLTVPGSATDARAFLGRTLEQAGWAPVFGSPSAGPGSMGFFLRGDSLCGFAVKMSGHDGACVVTVLHRRLNTGVSN